MHEMLYLNGRLLTREEARISPFDHGITVGDGVFESVITYGGKAFAARRHWERLERSATVLGLTAPTWDVFRDSMDAVISANSLTDARLRITLTGGEAPLGSEKYANAEPTLIVASMDLPQRPPLASIITVPWTRNERGALAGAKTTSYGENVVALAAAKAKNAQEAIFANTRGELCEGTGSNIFLVLNGQLHTPSLDSGCLAGVTRAIVLELCQEMGISVNEDPLPMSALDDAEEMFLTSTYREAQAVAMVDGKSVPAAPGEVTRKIAAAFREFVIGGRGDEAL